MVGFVSLYELNLSMSCRFTSVLIQETDPSNVNTKTVERHLLQDMALRVIHVYIREKNHTNVLKIPVIKASRLQETCKNTSEYIQV